MNGGVGGRQIAPLKSWGSGRGCALRFSSPLFPEFQGQGSGGIWTEHSAQERPKSLNRMEGGRKWPRPHGGVPEVLSPS